MHRGSIVGFFTFGENMNFCLAFVVFVVAQFQSSVHATSAPVFGSKTPYELRNTDWGAIGKEAQLGSSCKLVHLRVVARHGTRSLDEDKVEDAEKAIKAIRRGLDNETSNAQLTDEQIQAIVTWKNKLPLGKQLLVRGKAEHAFLAFDFFNLMKLSSPLFKMKFRFESSNVTRARESGVAFQAEWNKLWAAHFNKPEPEPHPIAVEESRLYFHKNCLAYSARVSKKGPAGEQQKRARTTPEASAIVEKINKRKFGLSKNELDFKDIASLYDVTAFSMAALNSSVFLPMFDDEDLAYLEFADDLEQYWVKSYTKEPITRRMTCSLTGHIFDTASEAYAKSKTLDYSSVESIFGFAHLETLLPVYATFGLFHDPKEGFVADASRRFYMTRKFDTSEMGKMASNIAFLFYDCPNNEAPKDRLVLLMVNGHPQTFSSACPYDLACPFDKVRAAYPEATSTCELSRVCSLDAAAAGSRSAFAIISQVTVSVTFAINLLLIRV